MESSSSAKSAMIGTWGLVGDRSILELGDCSKVSRGFMQVRAGYGKTAGWCSSLLVTLGTSIPHGRERSSHRFSKTKKLPGRSQDFHVKSWDFQVRSSASPAGLCGGSGGSKTLAPLLSPPLAKPKGTRRQEGLLV